MAYEATNPPICISPGGIAGPALWRYLDGDAHGDVDAANYFANAKQLGMKVGDIVFVINSSGYTVTTHAVASFSGDAATISAAVLA